MTPIEDRTDPDAHDDVPSIVVAAANFFARHPLPEKGAALVIGRDAEADVRIEHASVSRQHAMLRFGSPRPTIEDLGSRNGTMVNKRPLAPNERAAVGPGDVIQLGSAVVLIESGKKKAARRPTELSEDGGRRAPVVVRAEAMKRLYQLVDLVARGTINVLLLGETGVGKEVVARAVHARSLRAERPFLGLNCAAIQETLLESELFGHEKGAFTGADRAKPGLLESAEGGTIFLDEVGDMPLVTQAKLLRVIEERQVLRLGSIEPRAIDVRLVTATNRELEADVAAGRFRKDLFFRLNGVALRVPPLRERVVEIDPLARGYADIFAVELGQPKPEISRAAIDALMRYPWPGNIRELRNVIERAVLLSAGGTIEVEHLSLPTPPPAPVEAPKPAPKRATEITETQRLEPIPRADAAGGLRDEIRSLERDRILAALEACGGNQTRAAKELGISRRTLVAKLDEYGVPRPRRRES